jgi:hypothetical protein
MWALKTNRSPRQGEMSECRRWRSRTETSIALWQAKETPSSFKSLNFSNFDVWRNALLMPGESGNRSSCMLRQSFWGVASWLHGFETGSSLIIYALDKSEPPVPRIGIVWDGAVGRSNSAHVTRSLSLSMRYLRTWTVCSSNLTCEIP